jgi:hypothetical protein
MKILLRVVVCGSLTMCALFVLLHGPAVQTLLGSPSLGEGASSRRSEPPTDLEAVLFSAWFLDRAVDLDVAPLWASALGVDADNLVAYRDLKRQRERGEELQKDEAPLRESLESKKQILGRLVDGQVELLEAAKQFRSCDQHIDQRRAALIGIQFPGRTELERYCGRVLNEVEFMVECAPKDRALARVLAGLRSQFQHLKELGTSALSG